MQLVLVDWVDSFGCSSNWQPLRVDDLNDDPPEPVVCHSVGWLAHNGKDCKVVIPHVSEIEPRKNVKQGCGDMTIPTKAILSITPLVPQRKRKRN